MVNLINFNNGQLDLDSFHFTPIKDGEKLIGSVGYDYAEYPTEYSRDLENFLSQLLPVKTELDNLIDTIGASLYGKENRKLNIFNGTGENGKSSVKELIKNTFGDYCYVMSLNKNLEVSTLGNKKIIFINDEDVNNNSKILIGELMRENLQLKCDVYMICHNDPAILGSQIINFPIQFKNEYCESIKTELFKQDFMLMLIRHLKLHKSQIV
jgi:hypothetical protein